MFEWVRPKGRKESPNGVSLSVLTTAGSPRRSRVPAARSETPLLCTFLLASSHKHWGAYGNRILEKTHSSVSHRRRL